MSSAPRKRPMGHGHPGIVTEKPKDLKGTVRRLIAFLSRYRIRIVVVMLFAVASTVLSTVSIKVQSEATTKLFDGLVAKINGSGAIDFEGIAFILLLTVAISLIAGGCSFIQSWVMAGVAQSTGYEMRRMIEAKIDRLPFAYFEKKQVGDVLSRITNDVDTLVQGLSQGLTRLVSSVATIIAVLVMMLVISPVLTGITLLIIPISAILLGVVIKKSQKHFNEQQRILGSINSQVDESFSGHLEIKSFNREASVIQAFNAENEKLYAAGWKSQFISGLMMPLMNMVSNAGYVAIAVAGSMLAASRVITVGDIQAFIQYVRNFTQPIQQLTQVASVIQQMSAAAERVFEFLDEQEESTGGSVAAQEVVGSVEGAVEFNHVRFGYDPEAPVIKDFSASIAGGQTVALVGPTGAGKTTMVKLLMRFYDPQYGSISFDGVDIKSLDAAYVRSQISMVLQETWLFAGTIRENIRYGNLDATDAEVEEASKMARAHHFIMTQPDGYDMVITEDASNISLGQRQLITIARALLANRRILVLDEATSSVDTRTEHLIQEAMDSLMKDKTSFVIAHRLSTIRDADLILCMKDGDIIEQGTHEELLELGGFYARLYNSQFTEMKDN